ncbi:MAG: hypothetical protein AAGB15_05260 [Pseudomonadota bacterium]
MPVFQRLGFAGPRWELVATGDFSTDGVEDLLWFNLVIEAYRAHMIGENAATWQNLSSARSGYQIAGTADYSGDGADVILWFDPATRALGYEAISGPGWQDLGIGGDGWAPTGTEPTEARSQIA